VPREVRESRKVATFLEPTILYLCHVTQVRKRWPASMTQVEKRWPERSYFLLLLRHVARVVRREAACTTPCLQSGGLVSRP